MSTLAPVGQHYLAGAVTSEEFNQTAWLDNVILSNGVAMGFGISISSSEHCLHQVEVLNSPALVPSQKRYSILLYVLDPEPPSARAGGQQGIIVV